MDQHFLHHYNHNHHQEHRSRYAPPASQSHHHLPPPPALPPPPPISYRTIDTLPPPPPPPSYNPPLAHHSPRFPFYPIEEQRTLSNSFTNRNEHIPRRIVPESPWNPNPEDRPTRNCPPVDFHRDSHHHNHRPPPSYPPIRYESESSHGRLSSETSRLVGSPREAFVYGRTTNDDSYHRHHGTATSTSTSTSTSNLAYHPINEVSPRTENRRWLNDRKVHNSSPSHSPSFELVKDEIGTSVKREYHGSEAVRYSNGSNSGRSNSRECNHGREFSRTPPKKQIQKKSALLRIQTVKPNHRNRDIEQLRYVSDSNNNIFRGNNKDQHGGYTKGEDRKKGSSVELDISFESNSLVAKAIVTAPPSTSGATTAPVSGKLSSVVENLNDNNNNNTSQKNVGDACNPHDKHGVAVSVKGIGTSTRKLASKVVKKKKIVKRVVKKGSVNPTSSSMLASPSIAKAVGRTVQADSLTHISSNAASENVKTETCLEEKVNAVDKVSAPNNGKNVLCEDANRGLSLLSSGPECTQKCKINEDSDFGKESRLERGGSISSAPSCASSSLDKKCGSDSDCLNVCNSVHDLLSVTNIDKPTKSLNGSTSELNHLDCGNKQICQSEVSLSPGKYIDVGCSENKNLVDVGNELNSNVLSAYIIKTHNSADDSIYGFNSNDLTSSEEKITVDDSENNDIDAGAYCEKTGLAMTTLEHNSDTAIPLPCSGMVASLSLGDIRIQDGQDCLQHTSVLKKGSDDGSSSLKESIVVHQFGIIKDAEKQVSPGEVPIYAENCDIDKTFPNSNISLGFEVRDTSKIEKRNARTRLNFLSLDLDDISLTPVSHSNDADRGSKFLLKDPCPSEVLDHSIQSLDFYSLSNQVRGTALQGKRAFSETEFCVANNDSDDENKVSTVSKRKKVTASNPNLTQFQTEFIDSIVATTSSAEVPIGFSDSQEHKKDDVALSSTGMDIQYNAQSMTYSGNIAKLSDCIFTGGSFEPINANGETKTSEHLELQHSDIVSIQCVDLAIPNVQFSVLGCEQKDIVTPVVPITNTQTTDISVIGIIKGDDTDSQDAENNYHYRDDVQRFPRADMLSNDFNMKNDSLAQENLMSCPVAGDGVTISNSNNELIEDLPNALSDIYSHGMPSELPDRMITELTAINDDENICEGEENPKTESVVKHGFDSDTSTSLKHHSDKTMKLDCVVGCSDPITRNITPEPTQVCSQVTPLGLNSSCSELNGSKTQLDGVILKASQDYSFAFPKPKTKTPASSSYALKSRTWHRTDNNNPPASLPRVKFSARSVPPRKPILERKKNFQNTSYIRKGNSLVRNPTPVSAIPQISSTSLMRKPTPVSAIPQISSANLLPLGLGEIPKGTKPESRADLTDSSIYSKTKASNNALPIDTKSEENISFRSLEPPSSGCCENTTDLRKFIESNDAPVPSGDVPKQYEALEKQTDPSSNGGCQAEANDGNISSLNSKRIVYVKPKTNQLVATSSSSDMIISTDDKGQTAFSDSYFKRRKNQLVRNTFENHTVAMPNNIGNSDVQGASRVLCNRRFPKRRLHKVAGMSSKSSRASLVWTLSSKSSSRNDRNSWHYQRFPWKRATYLRSFIHNSASSFNSGSLSAAGKKLLLSRKRDTVYTRSTRGFSLWKSKVLGVGGSSLKWSKSIEKHSKKANEEATLAVAAVERKKREKKKSARTGSQTKRERIFRVGSVRYRMDPSRRTLQRISDDESLSSASTSSGLVSKRGYIPRRLVIGNDEYVTIGNGNQLIRDPKKRIRKLANEKVRWSLHTARQRLARKQKFCQFFTRFGKCNKDGGKCPYIHDPSKIAVCTKFLNGLCSTPNCKLTHKVLPERMPDCSYFLQGLCSNKSCSYRHVNVNPNASICEGFLKGYCADGNECRKKHSYVCPSFEATGTCTQGTKCKLHHPKKQSKGKKRKRTGDQDNDSGRYFGSIPADVSETGLKVAPSHSQQNEEHENELSDYISLDVYEEAADTIDQSCELSTFCDNDTMDFQLDTSDELIQPISIIPKFALQSQSRSPQA
ncbi:unnamed protein product [Lathyrus sativus]|nr:unnamed protein product [Lathyrus sativus]